ncbi:hypothetical protein AB0J01_37850 [Streptomyces sp. NPDC050204]|uniref:hypothetical protein n=1 Tax=Streptomyces sp. NPDC050204 TaxID=3155514 RepID=UPI0034151E81
MTSLNAPLPFDSNGRPVVVHSRHERELAVGHWLLSAAPDMHEARDQWAKTGIALLRCGGVFTAVRIQADIVQAAAGTEKPELIGAFLAEALQGGPVFIDMSSRRYYVLVPASTPAGRWVPGVERLGSGSFLGVPCPQRTEPEKSRSYWCVPMDGPGALCSPDAVTLLVSYGSHQQSTGQCLAVEAKESDRG